MAGAFGNSGFGGGGGGGWGSKLKSFVQGLPSSGLYNSWLGKGTSPQDSGGLGMPTGGSSGSGFGYPGAGMGTQAPDAGVPTNRGLDVGLGPQPPMYAGVPTNRGIDRPLTGGLEPNPGNVRYPPVPEGIPPGMWGQAQNQLMAQAQPQVGSQEWLQSPQGLSAFGDVTSRARAMGNPAFAGAAGMMRGRMGGEGAAAAARGTAYQQAEAAKQNAPASSYAGPPAAMGGGFTYDPATGVQGPAGYKGAPWYDPNRTGQTLAQYIQGLPPEERDALLAKYQAAGMPSPLGGTAGTPGNPFGV